MSNTQTIFAIHYLTLKKNYKTMGTRNFYNENAKCIYAVAMHSDECDSEFCNCGAQEEYDDVQINIQYAWKGCTRESNFGMDRRICHSVLFLGYYFASKCISKYFADARIDVCIYAIIRPGYYEGANLDWQIKMFVDGNQRESLEYDDLEYYMPNCNTGMAKIQVRNAQAWVDKNSKILIDELEGIYEQYSTPLGVCASFSNGETWYSKISK